MSPCTGYAQRLACAGCFVLLLLLFQTFAGAQPNITLRVQEKNRPVSFASVAFKATETVLATDSNGYMKMRLSAAKDTLTCTAIGYKTKRIFLAVTKDSTIQIELEPDTLQLPEVRVNNTGITRKRALLIGKKGKWKANSQYYIHFLRFGDQLALQLNTPARSYQIDKITFATSPVNPENLLLRIRVYAPDTTGKPGVDLCRENILARLLKNKTEYNIDLASNKIVLPDTTAFISIELLNDFNTQLNESMQLENVRQYGLAFPCLQQASVIVWSKRGNKNWQKVGAYTPFIQVKLD